MSLFRRASSSAYKESTAVRRAMSLLWSQRTRSAARVKSCYRRREFSSNSLYNPMDPRVARERRKQSIFGTQDTPCCALGSNLCTSVPSSQVLLRVPATHTRACSGPGSVCPDLPILFRPHMHLSVQQSQPLLLLPSLLQFSK